MLNEHYALNQGYDELIAPSGAARGAAAKVVALIRELGAEQLYRRQRAAEADIRALGVTFTVYDEKANIDREWPFDIIPRVLPATEWARLEQGLIGNALLERCDACRAQPLGADAGSAMAYAEERLSAIGELGEAIENVYFA